MTGSIDVFPQHRAGRRKGKPTIIEIVNDCIKTGQTPEALVATIRAIHPDKSRAEVEAAFRGEAERLAAETVKSRIELESFKEIFALIEAVRAELGDEDMASDQALWIAAERGNEQAILFWYDLATAVALDPDWGVGEDGVAVPKKGATYDSPEKLVAAYRAGRIDDPRPIEDVVNKICLRAFRSHGVTLDNIDDVDDATHQSVLALCGRFTDTHPRRKEIRNFFVEQGVREEIRRQCQERGIPLIED